MPEVREECAPLLFMFATTLRERPAAHSRPPWAVLLERFYARAGLALPRLEQLNNDEVPQPYKALLVHSSDMTPTLEGFYGQPLRLNVLSRERQEDSYLREVLLALDGSARPVAYGVIRIRLDHLPAPARKRVLEEQRPLGHILLTEGIAHLSWPQAFFRADSDGRMGALLRLRQPGALYGRRNVLLDGGRRLLAEVIEVLAPVAESAEGQGPAGASRHHHHGLASNSLSSSGGEGRGEEADCSQPAEHARPPRNEPLSLTLSPQAGRGKAPASLGDGVKMRPDAAGQGGRT